MKVAITGGIGSGKSYVCLRLKQRGITVYDCDAGAKRLMRSSRSLQQQLKKLAGDDIYIKDVLQKRKLAAFILESDEHMQQVDDIIHPAVASDFEQSGLDWLESAIYFDSGFYKRVAIDKVICVTAPLEIRLQRIMDRDGISREKALEWVSRQLPQDEVADRSDYVIINDGEADIDKQLDKIIKQIL